MAFHCLLAWKLSAKKFAVMSSGCNVSLCTCFLVFSPYHWSSESDYDVPCYMTCGLFFLSVFILWFFKLFESACLECSSKYVKFLDIISFRTFADYLSLLKLQIMHMLEHFISFHRSSRLLFFPSFISALFCSFYH